MAAAVARPFPFSDPHTVKHGARDLETNICSTALSFETQNPVSATPAAETLTASEDISLETESTAMTDCVTSVAPPAPSPSASTRTNPSQPNEVGGSKESSSVSPCPESSQESGPTLSPEASEAGFGGESSHEAKPVPTENFSFPGGGQMAPTEPCDQIVSAPAASGAANQTLTTIVVQPIEQVPLTTESQAPPKATETGPVQASAASRLWSVGAPTTIFAFGLLGGWLAV